MIRKARLIYLDTHTHTTKLTALSSRHSQSALEYMMTYGWAILIIVIVAATLWSFGVFSPGNSTSTTVTGFSGFQIQAQCIPGGAEQFLITNEFGYGVNISGVNVTGNVQTTSVINPYITLNPLQSISYYIQKVCPTTAGFRYSIQMTITYKELGQAFPGPYFSSGTLSGTSAASVMPVSVASFNGMNAWVAIPKKRAINITGTHITEVAWIYQTGPGANYPRILDGGTVNSVYTFVVNAAGGMLFRAHSTPTALSGAYLTNKWVQVAATFNGTMSIVYLNGSQSGSAAGSAALTWDGNPGSIGGNSNEASWFSGKISNAQLYNTTLSASQIQQLYLEGVGGAPIPSAGLTAWWPLNGNALDFGGTGDNGQTFNVTWVPP